MRAVFIAPLLLVACAQPGPLSNATTDINTADGRTQSDITTNAAVPTMPESSPLAPAEPGQPGGLPDDRTPIAEGPIAPDSPQGTANVVQNYYALIEGGKYRQAWLLWGEKGGASEMSADAFAASFARYREYHAHVGAPGRDDAGAGQRYVTVPVQVYARLKTGAPGYWRGDVVLHRTGDIDGATAEDRTWRIRSIDLKPAPPAKTR